MCAKLRLGFVKVYFKAPFIWGVKRSLKKLIAFRITARPPDHAQARTLLPPGLFMILEGPLLKISETSAKIM